MMEQFSIDKILEDVGASGVLGRSQRQYDLLKFLLEKTASGETFGLKAYIIAVDVFGRPEGFDETADSIVRVEMHRLRKNLKEFSHQSPYRLDIALASYEVEFLPKEKKRFGKGPRKPQYGNNGASMFAPENLRLMGKIFGGGVLGLTLLTALAFGVFFGSDKISSMQKFCTETHPVLKVQYSPKGVKNIPSHLVESISEGLVTANSSYSLTDIIMHNKCRRAVDYILDFSAEKSTGKNLYEVDFTINDKKTKQTIWSKTARLDENYKPSDVDDLIAGLLFDALEPDGIVPAHALRTGHWSRSPHIENYECSKRAKMAINAEYKNAQDFLLQCMRNAIESAEVTADLYATYVYLLQFERNNILPQKTWDRETKIRNALLEVNLRDPFDVQYARVLFREFRDTQNISLIELERTIENSYSAHKYNPFMRAQAGRMGAIHLGQWEEGRKSIDWARKILDQPDYFPFFEIPYAIVHETYAEGVRLAYRYRPFSLPQYEIQTAVLALHAGEQKLLEESMKTLADMNFYEYEDFEKSIKAARYEHVLEQKLLSGMQVIVTYRPHLSGKGGP